MTTMADDKALDDDSLASLARCLDTAVPAASGKTRPWLCAAVSCALHGLAVIGVVWAGLLDLSRALPVAEQVVEIDLAGLAGPAGAGGDGRQPGGGDGLPVAAPEPAAALAVAAPTADAASPAQALPTVGAAPAEQETPVAPPAPVLLPDPEAPQPPVPRPEPRPQPPPKPKPEAKRPTPAQPAAKASRPKDKPAAASSVAAAAATTRPPAEAAPGPSGTGPAGPGDGHGPGHGPGHGGFGGDGPGGGGGGEYVGQFGQGDGPCFRRRSLPSYPSEARRANLEGKVSLRLFIDAAGGLRNVEVLAHSGLEFVEEAIRAVRASSFSPARRGGQTVASRATLTIRFTIN